MSWRENYFERVRPVLGDTLAEGHVFVWGLQRAHVVAEALARTGLRQQTFFDEGEVRPGSAFCRTLGVEHAGRSRTAALEAHIRAHNHFEDDWQIASHPHDSELFSRCCAASPPRLIVGELDAQAPGVLRAAMDHHIPAVLTFLPRGSTPSCLQLVYHPQSTVDRDALLALTKELATLPALSEAQGLAAHIEHLEAASMALGLCRWLLAPERPLRPDLAHSIIERGAAIVLRGEPSWPWTVRFARPSHDIATLCVGGSARYLPPDALRRSTRLLVIGLGTASLFCGEALGLSKEMILLDGKEVSPFNPVRQLYPSSRIGEPKAEALAEVLARRICKRPEVGAFETLEALKVLEAGEHRFINGSLHLSARNASSKRCFGELLDTLKPDLAVVGMGRSKDDNFMATTELRKRGIRHVTPTAFPGVSHYKHIVTDGADGPCYDCLQGHLAIDGGAAPTLSEQERDVFYGGTQPATLAETLPSAHSLLRLVADLSLPPAARPTYLRRELASEQNCWVGANRTERLEGGGWLYGVKRPFQLVTYGIGDLVGSRAEQRCPCGRVNRVQNVLGRAGL
ncbi:MAG: hypothetical protein JRH20_11870 [Deltaproteobacteria bacterium]|nr:hypothetical protein [Deltaproteobacteria bacterium]